MLSLYKERCCAGPGARPLILPTSLLKLDDILHGGLLAGTLTEVLCMMAISDIVDIGFDGVEGILAGTTGCFSFWLTFFVGLGRDFHLVGVSCGACTCTLS